VAQYMVDFYKKPAVLSHTFESLRRICACMVLAKFETKSYKKFISPWVPQEICGAFILPKFVF
jgi:putative component of membrane protein insertase Oxa1/YidC/SpoIIIJ protein YidD